MSMNQYDNEDGVLLVLLVLDNGGMSLRANSVNDIADIFGHHTIARMTTAGLVVAANGKTSLTDAGRAEARLTAQRVGQVRP